MSRTCDTFVSLRLGGRFACAQDGGILASLCCGQWTTPGGRQRLAGGLVHGVAGAHAGARQDAWRRLRNVAERRVHSDEQPRV
jgi:hypothetical protein